MLSKLKIIGVMGSGSYAHEELSIPLGKWIAASGFHLLTGGGSGVMQAVSKAFVQTENRQGLSIGIIPGEIKNDQYNSLPNYPNPWIEIPVFTHLPLSGTQGKSAMSRNHINILSSDFIVVLPGSTGTISEVELALKYKKPVVGFYKDFVLLEKQKVAIPHFDNLSSVTKFILENLENRGG
jgi:uncharacterized protein (TIGR00725 family)